MAEYIDREILIKKLLEHFDAEFNINGDIMWSDHICTGEDVEDLINFIKKEIPAADVVKVVQCGQCERWKVNPNNLYGGQCRYSECASVDHFCSYGRKKGGAAEWKLQK